MSAQVKIRRVRMNDAPRLAELSGELGYPATANEIRARLNRLKSTHHTVFVAENAVGHVIGWLHVSVAPLLEVPLRGEINGLVVADGQRSQGTGAQLLQAAEDWARQQRCHSMSVRSNAIRERAHKFYERNGYEHYKTQKAFRKTL